MTGAPNASLPFGLFFVAFRGEFDIHRAAAAGVAGIWLFVKADVLPLPHLFEATVGNCRVMKKQLAGGSLRAIPRNEAEASLCSDGLDCARWHGLRPFCVSLKPQMGSRTGHHTLVWVIIPNPPL